MELDNIFFKNTVSIFKQAPTNFYSPCGRDVLLTSQEIKTRKLLGTKNIHVSNKEMVFRKIWEISLLPMNKWKLAYPVGMDFLKRHSLTNELVLKIIKELVFEIETLKKSKGRIVHNPY